MLGLKQNGRSYIITQKNADLLCTMAAHPEKGPPAETAGQGNDHCGDEIKNGGLFARNGVIEAVGETQDLPNTADMVIDMTWPCGHSRHGQYPSPYVSKSYPRRSCGTKRSLIWLACKPFIRSGAILARTIFTGQTCLAWPNWH